MAALATRTMGHHGVMRRYCWVSGILAKRSSSYSTSAILGSGAGGSDDQPMSTSSVPVGVHSIPQEAEVANPRVGAGRGPVHAGRGAGVVTKAHGVAQLVAGDGAVDGGSGAVEVHPDAGVMEAGVEQDRGISGPGDVGAEDLEDLHLPAPGSAVG